MLLKKCMGLNRFLKHLNGTLMSTFLYYKTYLVFLFFFFCYEKKNFFYNSSFSKSKKICKITTYVGNDVSENCPMETVSGKLEIRVVDRHLNGNDNYHDTANPKPIVCLEEDDEGLFVVILNL